MHFVAASFCPHPPLLVPAVASGAAPELDDLRAACDASIAAVLAHDPDEIVLLGAGPYPMSYDGTAVVDLSPYGLAPDPALAPDAPRLPLALAIGRWLLARAGWSGPVRTFANHATEGLYFGGGGDRRALLVMGDGSASRGTKAPGGLDVRAEPFDASVAAALASGDPDRLGRIDQQLAQELGAAGWPAWRAASELLTGASYHAAVRYDEAPYGVGYFVADWHAHP